MNILNKIWSLIKSLFVELNKEPVNSVLDVGIPADQNGGDDTSTDQPVVQSDTTPSATTPVNQNQSN